MIFTKAKLTKLKRAYTNAVKDKEDIFTFEGQELVTGYAKYLIEYLNLKFGIKKYD